MISLPPFRPVALDDLDVFSLYAPKGKLESCEYCPANIFMWRNACSTRWAVFSDRLFILYASEKELLMPHGSDFSPSELYDMAVHILPDREASIGHVSPEYVARNPELKDSFDLEMDDDYTDYIHRTANLFNLPGSRFHKKKNLLNQFRRGYPDYRSFRLEAVHLRPCYELAEKWCQDKTCELIGITHEQSAIREAIENYNALKLDGIGISIAGALVGFSIFSYFNGTCIVHFEKYDREFKGSAQAVNWETAKYVLDRCEFINREQDIGVPGLKQAKKSYSPDHFVSDYVLTLITEV